MEHEDTPIHERKGALLKIAPHRTDYGLVHTFGATFGDPKSLPDEFSIYDGRPIPNQNREDTRFTPPKRPLPMGCTGESGSFDAGLQDGVLYEPHDLYDNTPPGRDGEGRDIREMLKVLINRGPRMADGTFGPKRTAYFNCYGKGKIDDFDAARFALWINQNEKRGVIVGTWFYRQFGPDTPDNGVVKTPSFNTNDASLHCYLFTGWKTINGEECLEALTWQGPKIGFKGKQYFSRPIYNALMAQPWTGAFTITKIHGIEPVPIGVQAIIDHLLYYVRNLFGF